MTPRVRKIVLYSVTAGLALLQYDLWFGQGGVLSVWRLRRHINAAQARDSRREERNAALTAQVVDLKHNGLASAQDEARSELGMARKDEMFYQVVPGAPPTQRFVPYPDGSAKGYGKGSN